MGAPRQNEAIPVFDYEARVGDGGGGAKYCLTGTGRLGFLAVGFGRRNEPPLTIAAVLVCIRRKCCRKTSFEGAAVTIKRLFRIAVALFVVSTAGHSAAITPYKDKAALKKIDEAVNVHYIGAQFDKAETVLLGAIKSCGKDCSPETLSRAYLYLGIVRGNGKQDLAGAKQAFDAAYAADPNVTIDPSLVTPAVFAEFNKATGKQGDAAQAPPPSDENVEVPGEKKPGAAPRAAPVGDLVCTPATGYEVQVGRPIPIHCERRESVLRGELYYRAVDRDEYTPVLMKFNSKDATLSAQVPCDAVTKKGTVSIYVNALDEEKQVVDTFGNALSPVQYTVVDKPSQPPPTLPGERAPEVCTDLLKSLNSGVALGEVCTHAEPCKAGLYCQAGKCEKAPTCETGSECGSGHCIDGYCVMAEQFADDDKPNKWMVGVNFGWDLWLSTSRKNVCGGTNPASGVFSCYSEGKSTINVGADPATTNRLPMADPNWGGNIKTTLVPATFRAMLSIDRILSPRVTLGGRLGMAFNGGPAKMGFTQADGSYIPNQKSNFLPVHVEVRGAYWFKSLDELGLHPYVALSGGLAEVDAKITVKAYADDADGRPRIARKLDAWRKLGVGFASASTGALYSFSKRHGAQLNLNVMVMFPSAGLVLEPSLGYVFAF
jgi:hypothetical protein